MHENDILHQLHKHSLNITSTLILKQTGYTFFIGFHDNKTYNTFVCGNTICSYMVFPQTKVLYS